MMNSAQSVYLRLFLFFVLITAVPLLAQPPKLEDMGNDALVYFWTVIAVIAVFLTRMLPL